MHDVEVQQMSPEFYELWRAAGDHLDNQVEGGVDAWLRGHPYPPFLEHLSFRMGNQLFFVRVVDVAGKVIGPGSKDGVLHAAAMARGHACVMPMTRETDDGPWVAATKGWGLHDATTRAPINPPAMITAEPIQMTPWEQRDLAVLVVRQQLEREGFEVLSFTGDPNLDPAIWFTGTSGGPEWVVVRHAAYPATRAERPTNWDAIAAAANPKSAIGHFASVALSSADQGFDPYAAAAPLLRGAPLGVRFDGLE